MSDAVIEYLVYDCETPPNMTMVGIKVKGEAPWILELTKAATEDQCAELENRLMGDHREQAGYNSAGFDDSIVGGVLDRLPPAKIHAMSQAIIVDRMKPFQAARMFRSRPVKFRRGMDLNRYVKDASLTAAANGGERSSNKLKAMAARLGMDVQEMPFAPTEPIPDDGVALMRAYLMSDLQVTEGLRWALDGEVQVRAALERMYGIDGLRYQTAANCAGEVILTEYIRATDVDAEEIKYAAGRNQNCTFNLELPGWIMEGVRGTRAEEIARAIQGAGFQVIDGKRSKPDREWPSVISLDDDGLTGTFGLGGFHSIDPACGFVGGGYDAQSMYPSILMRGGCAPAHLDEELFQAIYGAVIKQRLKAKRAGDKLTSNGLKLVLNSTFGAMNYAFGRLYSPARFLNITISGQLALLALTDRQGGTNV